MQRAMVGFHRDDEGDWVAHLDCGHTQHVRHRPPFQERPWVVDEAGRRGRIGAPLECPLCDRGELPEGLDKLRVPPPASEPQGGEAACYAHLLCPDCGVVLGPGAVHRPGCLEAP